MNMSHQFTIGYLGDVLGTEEYITINVYGAFRNNTWRK